jgi:Sigma-54 interaction domain
MARVLLRRQHDDMSWLSFHVFGFDALVVKYLMTRNVSPRLDLIDSDGARLAPGGIWAAQDPEWRRAWANKLNVLFVGPDDATRALIRAYQPDLARPVVSLSPGYGHLFSDPTDVETLICYDIASFTAAEQERLMDRLDRAAGRVQVITTASQPMLPMISAGLFIQRLYYRLNTFYVDLTASR